MIDTQGPHRPVALDSLSLFTRRLTDSDSSAYTDNSSSSQNSEYVTVHPPCRSFPKGGWFGRRTHVENVIDRGRACGLFPHNAQRFPASQQTPENIHTCAQTWQLSDISLHLRQTREQHNVQALVESQSDAKSVERRRRRYP